MTQQKGHYHAYTVYDLVGLKHYLYLMASVIECKLRKGKSLTVHLPYPQGLRRDNRLFRKYGEHLKQAFNVKLYWENAPWLNYGTWDLKYKPDHDPFWFTEDSLELCLDTGHLMLGSTNKRLAQSIIKVTLLRYGNQIKHIHLHENDLVHDLHLHTHKILTKALVKRITKGRTFIWEK